MTALKVSCSRVTAILESIKEVYRDVHLIEIKQLNDIIFLHK